MGTCFAIKCRGPGVEFVCDSAAPLHADPELIKLLIQNLVDNAVKFSHPDSTPVIVELETDNDQVVLRVTDDGIGIPQGSEDQLFKPFVKGDPARGHGVGYGIGLSLCQRIVQLHGGSIRLQARAPRGTDVVVTLGSESWPYCDCFKSCAANMASPTMSASPSASA